MTFDELLKKYDIPPPYCGAGCGDGWLPLIERLIVKLIDLGWDKDCHQIKEKFGGLRFYIGAGEDEVRAAIDQAEAESFKVCEDCGAPGKRRSGGWIKTRCNACEADRSKTRLGPIDDA